MIIIVCQSDPCRAQLHNLFIITIRSAHHFQRMLFALLCDIFGLHVNLANKLQVTHFFIPPSILLCDMTVVSPFNSTPDIFSHNFSIRNLAGLGLCGSCVPLDTRRDFLNSIILKSKFPTPCLRHIFEIY